MPKSILILLLVTLSFRAGAQGEEVGVIYPDMREPFKTVFTTIIEGILDVRGDETRLFSVKKDGNPQDVVDWAEDNDIEKLIALGSRAQRMVELLNLQMNRKIVGATIRPPDLSKGEIFDAGIMLTPDPERVYQELMVLVPKVTSVYVIYSESSDWYLDIARKKANAIGINLIALKSNTLQESVMKYRQLLKEIEKEAAIWLLQDSLTSDSKLILPMVLEASWDKKIPVVSNVAGHVSRGILFAQYPDYFKFGTELGNLINEKNQRKAKFIPFSAVLRAANTRAANHLGLNWSRSTVREFNLVFPSQ